MLFSRATSRMVWSSRAPTSRPSMVSGLDADGDFAGSCGHLRRLRLADARPGSRCRRREPRIPSRKYRSVLSTGLGAVCPSPHRLVFLHQVAELFQQRQIRRRGLSGGDLLQDVVHLLRADAARNALAAGFGHAELHEELGHIHHAGGLVHHDHAARAHDGADASRAIRNPPANPGARAGMQPPEGPPVCTALNCLPSGMPPPMSKMISRSVMPMGTSIRPVLFDPAGQGEHLGALALFRADGGEPVARRCA